MFVTASTSPIIEQRFDPMLLDQLAGLHQKYVRIIRISIKKIRAQDTGKRKKFHNLVRRFEEAYERKKTEKEEYETKIKNAPKRPSVPITGGIMRFRRLEPKG